MTNAAEQPNSRLDRIERLLEQTATRLDQVSTKLDQFAVNQIELQQSINRVDQRLEATISETVNMIVQVVEDAETEREVFQSEILRIWEYLLNQQPGNGRG